MQFFLNREDGIEKFKTGHEDFLEYYNICRIYNKVSNIMDDEPEAAIMYWDDKKEVVSMGFPTDGSVSKALSGISPHSIMSEEDEDEDEDEFGLFK